MTTAFLDPGPLVDDELELVSPHARWIDDLLAACRHPMTKRDAPKEAETSRESLERFLKLAPLGREPADGSRVPSYHFWMKLNGSAAPLPIAGGIAFRFGTTSEIETYVGHVGYHVYPPA